MVFASKIYIILLVIWSIVMTVWGLAGFLEYFTGITPGLTLQNNAYPNGVQFVHWLLISLTGITFLLGYFMQWKFTPIAMCLLFSNLALLCTIETFDFMSEQWSIKAYLTELVFYFGTAIFLMYATVSKAHFHL